MNNIFPNRRPQIRFGVTLVLAAVLAFLLNGCQKPPGAPFSGDLPDRWTALSTKALPDLHETFESQNISLPTETQAATSQPDTAATAQDQNQSSLESGRTADTATRSRSSATAPTTSVPSGRQNDISLLADLDLPDCVSQMRKCAESAGFAAALVQPDRNRQAQFLIVAANALEANQLNGYFYWLADPDVEQIEQQMILCIDRLFTEQNRERVIASDCFYESSLVEQLDQALKIILKQSYHQDVLTYILDCYNEDFQIRLTEDHHVSWRKKQVFSDMEVTYEASIYSSVSFAISSNG